MLILLAKFIQITFFTLSQSFVLSSKEVIVSSLSLIELALIANLLLMVIFSSYEGFVSRLNDPEQPNEPLHWREQVGFGVLKLRIMASVAAIAGVYLLEKVIEAGEGSTTTEIMWAAIAFGLFVAACLVLAIMERFSERPQSHSAEPGA